MPPVEDDSTLVSPEAFVRTYEPPNNLDPWTLLDQYRRTIEFAASHPDLRDSAISNRLEIPRSRVRGWLTDESPSRPDCVRGLERADDRGWIRISPNSETFRGLNILVAGVFAGGTIVEETYGVRYSLGDGFELDQLREAFERTGVTFDVVHADSESRPTELVPAADDAILGRVLSVLGAPVGQKAKNEYALPPYLEHVDESHQRAFARAYVQARGSDGQWGRVHIKEERSDSYLDGLAAFLERLTGGTVYRSAHNVILPRETAAALDRESRKDRLLVGR